MSEAKKKRGRPSVFKKDHIRLAKEISRFGLTDEETATVLGISLATLKIWKNKHSDFLAALNEGKDFYDNRVVRALRERSIGYSHPEEKIFYNTKTGEVVRVPTTKHYPPDPTSMIFWLKNRKPKEWRDKQEMEISTPPEGINLNLNIQGKVEKVQDQNDD